MSAGEHKIVAELRELGAKGPERWARRRRVVTFSADDGGVETSCGVPFFRKDDPGCVVVVHSTRLGEAFYRLYIIDDDDDKVWHLMDQKAPREGIEVEIKKRLGYAQGD